MRFFLALSALALCACGAPTDPKPPTFSNTYSATGFIHLPYAELREPFDAYYDANTNSSRIDYYNGEMLTLQLAKSKQNGNGAAYRVIWSPNKQHVVERTCYQSNGTDTEGNAIANQNIIPSLDGFSYAGQEQCTIEDDKTMCDKFVMKSTTLNRTSKYSFWALQNNGSYTPKRYEMMGYNSLLGSHYDKYVIVYTSFKDGAVNADVFNITKLATKCIPYPSGAGLSASHLFNPMKEFVHHDESHLDEHFEHFKNTHNQKYEEVKEHETRKNNFRHNLRYINSQNRRKLSYSLAVNHLAAHSKFELKSMFGKKTSPNAVNKGTEFPREKYSKNALPEYFDWRLYGAVTPVKDQAICGSCWSFGTVAHIEGQYFLKNGRQNLVRFSEQQLVDCSWNEGNGGCDGGEDFQAYNYIMNFGLSTDEQYGAYKGIDAKCHEANITNKPITTIAGYVNVTGIDNLKMAIANIGPISVGIDVIEPLVFYNRGVFSDPTCGNKPEDLNHAVLAVGYGTIDGQDYILIKNSWSTYWGNDGYMLMAQKDNMCGVATAATYVNL